MKKVAMGLGVIVGVYVLLFFLWVPINLMAVKYNQSWLISLSYRYDDIAHNSWAGRLEKDNMLLKLRTKNTLFWCNQFDKCVVNLGT